jgi:hypothetical protein
MLPWLQSDENCRSIHCAGRGHMQGPGSCIARDRDALPARIRGFFCAIGMALFVWGLQSAEGWLLTHTCERTSDIVLGLWTAGILIISWRIDRSDARKRKQGLPPRLD